MAHVTFSCGQCCSRLSTASHPGSNKLGLGTAEGVAWARSLTWDPFWHQPPWFQGWLV